jgi:hypothetical protein
MAYPIFNLRQRLLREGDGIDSTITDDAPNMRL